MNVGSLIYLLKQYEDDCEVKVISHNYLWGRFVDIYEVKPPEDKEKKEVYIKLDI